jgi:choline-sulfatase
MPVSADEAEDIVARYDGGIRKAQAAAVRILDAAAASGRPYLAIVTADHGESLGDEDRWFHGGTPAPELLAVPLVVFGRGVIPGRVSEPAGHASVRRTLLLAGGVECAECRGSDLRTGSGETLVTGGIAPKWSYRVMGRHKLLVQEGRAPQLFDTESDPGEQRDLAAQRPEILARLLAEDPGHHPAQADVAERLRALGYLGS